MKVTYIYGLCYCSRMYKKTTKVQEKKIRNLKVKSQLKHIYNETKSVL